MIREIAGFFKRSRMAKVCAAAVLFLVVVLCARWILLPSAINSSEDAEYILPIEYSSDEGNKLLGTILVGPDHFGKRMVRIDASIQVQPGNANFSGVYLEWADRPWYWSLDFGHWSSIADSSGSTESYTLVFHHPPQLLAGYDLFSAKKSEGEQAIGTVMFQKAVSSASFEAPREEQPIFECLFLTDSDNDSSVDEYTYYSSVDEYTYWISDGIKQLEEGN